MAGIAIRFVVVEKLGGSRSPEEHTKLRWSEKHSGLRWLGELTMLRGLSREGMV